MTDTNPSIENPESRSASSQTQTIPDSGWPGLYTRLDEVCVGRPVAELGGVATDADVDTDSGDTAVEEEHLVPTGRAHVGVRRSLHGAGTAGAGDDGLESAGAHRVAVGGRDGSQQGGGQVAVAGGRVGEGDGDHKLPGLVGDGEGRAGLAAEEVGGREDIDAVLLRVDGVIG